jgi:tRNA/rRNA methyltransferase
MANFGLSQLRLVKPRPSWPSPKATMMAAGADRILDGAVLFDTLAAAIADCTFVLATTARAHDQAKPVVGAAEAAADMAARLDNGETVAVLFGRERNGLENDEVALADRIVTLPVNPAFASLNLAQAVVIIAYEWFKCRSGVKLPFAMPQKSPPAPKQQLLAFFAALEGELERVEFFRPPDKRATMQINLRNIFSRMQPTQQDVRTLHGVFTAIAAGRKGPARGGVLDSEQAAMLRALIAEEAAADSGVERSPLRGLARLLRRNPTEAERALWQALTNDRRFAGLGFKRQTPVGQHICDLVSFPLHVVIDLLPAEESAVAAKTRADKRAWLAERGYRVIEVGAEDIAADVAIVLDRLAATLDPVGARTKR